MMFLVHAAPVRYPVCMQLRKDASVGQADEDRCYQTYQRKSLSSFPMQQGRACGKDASIAAGLTVYIPLGLSRGC